MSGAAAELTVAKIAGAWRTGVIGLFRSPGFETNDPGFLQAADRIRAATWLGYVRSEGGRHFRNWSVFTNQRWGWTTAGEPTPGMIDLNSLFQLRNHWRGFVGMRHHTSGLRPEWLRGGPALRVAARTGGWARFVTDPRRRVNAVFTVIGDVEHDAPGSTLSVAVGPTFRPTPAWSVSVTPNWTRNVESQQYVAVRSDADANHYILGLADRRTLSLVTRLTVTFSPGLTLEPFAQPFISTVRYEDFKRVGTARASDADQRWAPYAADELRPVDEVGGRPVLGFFADGESEPRYTFADPGFGLQSLRGNAVLRWEYRPGSTLYVVWQHDRRASGFADGFDLADDLRGLGDAGGDHVLTIKASYRLGR